LLRLFLKLIFRGICGRYIIDPEARGWRFVSFSREVRARRRLIFMLLDEPYACRVAPYAFVGNKVCLSDLGATQFNGRTGSVVELCLNGRVRVHLACTGEKKAIWPVNLAHFTIDLAEPCQLCGETLVLSDFPECACPPGSIWKTYIDTTCVLSKIP